MKYKFLAISILSLAALTAVARPIELSNLNAIDSYNKNDAKRVTSITVHNLQHGTPSLPTSIMNFSKLETLVITGKPVSINPTALPASLKILACKGCENLAGSFKGTAMNIDDYYAKTY